ncbi:MAG TPA: GlsB/YeaQ/YmgE family stress response membrane protein [Blastocatellia bacterium]|jgi:uncharacterized membrane protein YeaQ/YmgE (transglycosylase-associated protein family)
MGLFELIWTVIIGVVIGFVARFVLPGKDPMGLIMTAILGIAGSFVGTFLGRMLFGRSSYSAGFIMSVIGAVILLLLYRMIAKRSA